jgi:hypothetical protein
VCVIERRGERGAQRRPAFFQNLGMSTDQINVLMTPRARTFPAQCGKAIERAVSDAFSRDPQLSGMLLDARNAPGTVFPTRAGGRPLRPDWGLNAGPLQGNIVDLSTVGSRGAKMTKYHDRVITLEYVQPSF